MNRLHHLCLLLLLTIPQLFLSTASAAVIPEVLQDWEAWVLEKHPQARCSFQWNRFDSKQCIWPSRLQVDIQGDTLTFNQALSVEAAGWHRLPGNDQHWPEVYNEGQKLPVVARNGGPAVRLQAGDYALQGRIDWRQATHYLQLPAETGLVSAVRDGKAFPVTIDNKHRLWLRQQNKTERKKSQADTAPVRVQVFRQIRDAVPVRVTTILKLEVSGEPKELLLPNVMLDAMIPMRVDSPLPARVENNGAMRVQARQGVWELRIEARVDAGHLSFALPAAEAPMPKQQIWAVQADPSLRSISIEGAPQIDPSQSNLPQRWRNFPAYLLQAGEALAFVEHSRGDAQPAANELKVQREFWLDFSGTGLTVSDEVQASVQTAMRLNTQAPFELGRAEINGEPVLLSSLDAQAAGLEMANGNIQLYAVSRVDSQSSWRRVLPAVGWQHNAETLKANVHLPPGWKVLAASGVDNAPQTWLAQWSLFDIFMVLVLIMAYYRLFGGGFALLLTALLLIAYNDHDIPVTLWLLLAVATGLLKVVEQGKLRRGLQLLRDGSLLLLLFVALGFSAERLQHAMYPVLAKSQAIYQTGVSSAGSYAVEAMSEMDMGESMPHPKARKATRMALEELVIAEAPQKRTKQEQEYDPNAYVQTGPGLPDWQWQRLALQWAGPVLADQQFVLYTLPPFATRLLNVISVLLLALLMLSLLRRRWQQQGAAIPTSAANAAVVLLLPLVFTVGMNVSPNAQASSIPDDELLSALEEHLLKAPDCVPNCAALSAVQLRLSNDVLVLQLAIDSAANTVIDLPAARDSWLPQQVLLNGSPAERIASSGRGRLRLALPEGNHRVTLRGPVLADDLSLDFSLPAHNVSASVEGWQVSGISRGRLPNNTLMLKREQLESAPTEASAETLLAAAIAPFVSIERELRFDVDWRMTTTVRRVAPNNGVIDLKLPLLEGERVLHGVRAEDGMAQLRMAANSKQVRWQSRLTPREHLVLQASANDAWVEQWVLRAQRGRWNMRWEGVAPIKQASASAPRWLPRAGDTLTVQLREPQPVPGAMQTIESVDLLSRPGLRSNDLELSLSMRAGQGGTFAFDLPEGARIVSVQAGDRVLPLPNGQRVEFPVLPGLQRLQVNWQENRALGLRSQSPALKLGLDAANINIRTEVPGERWMLLVGGPDMGPAVLFWGVLSVVVLLALALGRLRFLPLKTWEWLLLGIGLSTVNSFLGLAVLIWFVLLYWRGTQSREVFGGWFNFMQLGIIIATAIALLCLLSAIPLGLLSTPNMHIAGNGSSNHLLQWYQDRAAEGLPQGWFLSLPLWVYRAAMLLWSLWIASALMRWLPWAWQQFSHDGWWENAASKRRAKTVDDAGEKATISAQEDD